LISLAFFVFGRKGFPKPLRGFPKHVLFSFLRPSIAVVLRFPDSAVKRVNVEDCLVGAAMDRVAAFRLTKGEVAGAELEHWGGAVARRCSTRSSRFEEKFGRSKQKKDGQCGRLSRTPSSPGAYR